MILVTGARGFVGSKIMQMCDGAVASPSLRDATEDDVRRIVEESGADVIVHTAAISDVGACIADPDASFRANVALPVYLAKAARGIKLICFSSDQVYTGSPDEGPYTEDQAKPDNVYACHKLEMEQRVLDIAPDSVMLRAEWMYDFGGAVPNALLSGEEKIVDRGNYFTNIVGAKDALTFSSRNYRGVTYVKEVAENIPAVCKLPGGAYNFGSETTKSIYEITKGFLAALGKDLEVRDCPPLHNLWINCEKARKHGVTFRSVEEGLLACLRDSRAAG